MQPSSSFPLPDDIIYRLLVSLSDLHSLSATITICKVVHAVYNAHSKTIARTVESNEYGSLQALRLARVQLSCTWPSHYPPIPAEEDISEGPLRAEDREQLAKNAACVRKLEDLFSTRHKDKTSLKSRLTSTESFRFRRALYRLWLITWHPGQDNNDAPFPWNDSDNLETAYMFNPEDHGRRLRELYDGRTHIIGSINNQELLELHAVYVFLSDLFSLLSKTGSTTRARGYIYYRGPHGVLRVYSVGEERYSPSIPETLDPILIALNMRNLQSEASTMAYRPIILDHILGELDRCDHCGSLAGLQLYNITNWEIMKACIPESDVFTKVRRGAIKALGDAFSYPSFMQRLFDLRVEAFAQWTEEQWTCKTCLLAFIDAHLGLYLLDYGWRRTDILLATASHIAGQEAII